MFKILFTEAYDNKAKKFFKQHPDIKKQYEKTLELLESNPYHQSLRLHRLKGRLKHLYSVSINIVYRIIIEFIFENDKIILIDVGSHDDIYD